MAIPHKQTKTLRSKFDNTFFSLLTSKTAAALKLFFFASFLFFSNSKAFAQTVVVNTSTVQSNFYTVTGGPKQISFVITGGQGGHGSQAYGGQGATASATYNLNDGDVIRYLVAEGGRGGNNTGGGGGSTAIYINNTISLIAGGGGGGGAAGGRGGTNNLDGTPGTGTAFGAAGTGGNGGAGSASGAAGGGFNTPGGNATTGATFATGGGVRSTDGSFALALGGNSTLTSGNGGRGFTGGGGGTGGFTGGAGGGFSGGGGAGTGTGSTAGGGGSGVNTGITGYVSSTIIAGVDALNNGAFFTNGNNGSVNITAKDLTDTDSDGIADVNDEDSDNDGILDVVECPNFSFSKDLIINNANAGLITVVEGGASGTPFVNDAGPNNNEPGLRYTDQASEVTYYRLNTQ
ncbi:thrombospondin type 3 repeat-containing protein, partial [Polaribacter sp. 11A2H]|uniref:thrombospondin type 3 repeat-containing protein n=1 Tax=Polaribacter sp. 11A2H TaxID=2687290 RepID=UPI00197B1C19